MLLPCTLFKEVSATFKSFMKLTPRTCLRFSYYSTNICLSTTLQATDCIEFVEMKRATPLPTSEYLFRTKTFFVDIVYIESCLSTSVLSVFCYLKFFQAFKIPLC